ARVEVFLLAGWIELRHEDLALERFASQHLFRGNVEGELIVFLESLAADRDRPPSDVDGAPGAAVIVTHALPSSGGRVGNPADLQCGRDLGLNRQGALRVGIEAPERLDGLPRLPIASEEESRRRVRQAPRIESRLAGRGEHRGASYPERRYPRRLAPGIGQPRHSQELTEVVVVFQGAFQLALDLLVQLLGDVAALQASR